jgi:2,3-bisphosphoglycerate-dependent phosphoglycerate mutase
MTHLYLIRHAEAVVNVRPIIGGMKGCTGLTERGVAQAEALRDRLAHHHDITADVLIASTLPRAAQTAEIIAPALNQPIVWDDDMQEIQVGEADGLSHDEAWSRFGQPGFENDPFRPIAPGGENWGQFMLRVSGGLYRITRDHAGQAIVVVCHGGVIDGAFAYFLNINTRSPRARLEFYPHNTSITHWELYAFREQARWRLERYNDICHLRDIGVFESPRWSEDEA